MRAFAIIEMRGEKPDIDREVTPFGGYCIGAHQGIYGLYFVSGTAAQLTAVAALPNVWRICTLAEMDDVITTARRNKMNEWLTAQGWPTIPAGWTYGQVVRYAFARANPNWDETRFFLVDQ